MLSLLTVVSSVDAKSGYFNLNVNNDSSQQISLVKSSGWTTVIPAHTVVNLVFKGNSVASAYFDDDRKCQWFIPGINVIGLNFAEDAPGHYRCSVVMK